MIEGGWILATDLKLVSARTAEASGSMASIVQRLVQCLEMRILLPCA
jgi:hypothetical protein